jgi:hypothetical protein
MAPTAAPAPSIYAVRARAHTIDSTRRIQAEVERNMAEYHARVAVPDGKFSIPIPTAASRTREAVAAMVAETSQLRAAVAALPHRGPAPVVAPAPIPVDLVTQASTEIQERMGATRKRLEALRGLTHGITTGNVRWDAEQCRVFAAELAMSLDNYRDDGNATVIDFVDLVDAIVPLLSAAREAVSK